MDTKPPKVLRLKAVCELTGLSRSSIYLKMSRNEFPKPIKLGRRSIAWVESEVNQWITLRIQESRSADSDMEIV